MSSLAALLNDSNPWLLHADTYTCLAVNPDGKKFFDRVNRIKAKGQDKQVDLLLDIASEHFALGKDESFTLAVTSTLRLDGKPDEDAFNQDGKPSLLDSFSYGMCGRVFRVDSLERTEVSVIASFGGLLMQLKGEMKHLVRIKMDDRVYLLIKKI